jgi:predicted PhzF superfamily epimerase YddE/YHI9
MVFGVMVKKSRVSEGGNRGAAMHTTRTVAAISLDAADLLGGGHGAEGWSCGLPFLFVPLKDRDAVGRMKIDPAAWDKAIADYPATAR